MSGVALGVMAAAAVVGTGYSIYAGEEGRRKQSAALDQQRQAQAQAVESAKKQEKISEENINKANSKQPDTAAIISAANQGANQGAAGTMLTGPMGIDPSALSLGKNTLLGG